MAIFSNGSVTIGTIGSINGLMPQEYTINGISSNDLMSYDLDIKHNICKYETCRQISDRQNINEADRLDAQNEMIEIENNLKSSGFVKISPVNDYVKPGTTDEQIKQLSFNQYYELV